MRACFLDSYLVKVSLLVLLLMNPLAAIALDWPQDVVTERGTIVVYQPQPESLNGNILQSRAAVSFEIKGQDQPIFGAFWFSARLDINGDVAIVRSITVDEVRWPDSTEDDQNTFSDLVSSALSSTSFEISMSRLSASLEDAELQKQSLETIKNEAPEIRFTETLSVLLSYDGKPQFRAIEDSPYERVLNTPFAIARDTNSQKLYLSSGTFWYTASDPMGPWEVTQSPPTDLVSMVKSDDAVDENLSKPPAIVTSDTPTELVASDGAPQWQSLIDGQLLYVSNTETPWIRETNSGDMYLLLSGRWFSSRKQTGPWDFVRSDQLPESFNNIPPDSDIGGLRVSVAGTNEANQAVMDAQIPQTAAIKRDEASLEVEYDGNPQFEAISSTNVSYAINTATQVLLISNEYYAVDNGVWFTSNSAKGPWIVADSIPEQEIAQIPTSSPVYNTTYVQVYDSTPEVVYVGYTPGYLWSYPYYGVPVYGTGWYYPPYWGRYYYPRPPTWGLHVGYNPWTGWTVGVSWGVGFFHTGYRWRAGYGNHYNNRCCGGFYGGGYRRPVVINTGDINIGNNINIGNRARVSQDIDKSKISGDRIRKTNLYNQPETRDRLASPALANKELKKATHNNNRKNDVFADRNGNVARDKDGTWQNRSDGKWNTSPSTRETIPAVSKPATRPTTPSTRPAVTPSQRPTATPVTKPTTPTRQPSTSQPIRSRPSNTHQSRNLDHQSLDRARNSRQSGAAREAAARRQR